MFRVALRKLWRDRTRPLVIVKPETVIHAIQDPYPELKQPPPRFGKLLALPILGGVQHD